MIDDAELERQRAHWDAVGLDIDDEVIRAWWRLSPANRETTLMAFAMYVLHLADVEHARICSTCGGCGQVADTNEQEPWTAWASLPLGSDVAVRVGLVRPIPCPDCGVGRG